MYCLFCVVLCTVCVYMCTVLLPPGGYPIEVKYIISYLIISHIISYHISCHIMYIISCHVMSYPIISYYVISHHSANLLPTFRNNLSVPSSRAKRCWISLPLTMGHIVTFEDGTIRFALKRRQCITTIRCVISQKIADLSLNVPSGIQLTDRSAESV
jgi:hypothetical protein